MKSLSQLDNTAKAKILHELFPEEVKPLVENIKQVCFDFEEHQQQYRKAGTLDFSALMNGSVFRGKPCKG